MQAWNPLPWLAENKEGIAFLAMVLGLVGAVFTWLWTQIARQRQKQAPVSEPNKIVVQIDPGHFAETLRAELKAVAVHVGRENLSTPRPEPQANLLDAVEQVSALRDTLRPPPLSPEIFPPELDVMKFDEARIALRIKQNRAAQILGLLFTFFFYIVFFGGILTTLGVRWPIALLIGFALWAWRAWRGTYVSVDRKTKRYKVISPGGGSWFHEPPKIAVVSRFLDNAWRVVVTVGGQAVLVRSSRDLSKHPDIETFSQSLLWDLGDKVEVAPGVFIAP